MALWRLYYHFVWATKEREPMITPELEEELYGYMLGKGHSLGAIVHAIGGTENHVHVVASVPPKLSLAEFVKGVKGSSSFHMNHGVLTDDLASFGWQRGYGVFSFGGKRLGRVVEYATRQKEHHREGRIIARLEEDDQEDDGPCVWDDGSAIAGIRITPV